MPNNLFTQPLELKIGEHRLRFNSVDDIAFSMEGRTAISSEKLSELFKLSIDQLDAQAKTTSRIKKSLFSIISRTAEEPESIERSIRELDLQIISQDRNWRDIIQALNEGDEEYNTIRTTVLTKYVKYLYSLEDAISYICTERKKSNETKIDENEKEAHESEATLVPDHVFSESAVNSHIDVDFKRLPYDKELSIKLPPGERMDVRLASYKCQLVATDEDVQFIDNTGTKKTLIKGINIVGRGSKCTVKVDGTQKEISRIHLQIFISDDYTLQLTDTSLAGTFINAKFLK